MKEDDNLCKRRTKRPDRGRGDAMTTGRRTGIGLATVATLVALWFVVTQVAGLISAGRFPSPSDTWDAFQQVAFRGYERRRLAKQYFGFRALC